MIGNPPYGGWFDGAESEYFAGHYEVFAGTKDVYVCFVERGFGLTKPTGGKLSYIVPSAWLGGPDYMPLRQRVMHERVEYLVLLPFDVFLARMLTPPYWLRGQSHLRLMTLFALTPTPSVTELPRWTWPRRTTAGYCNRTGVLSQTLSSC